MTSKKKFVKKTPTKMQNMVTDSTGQDVRAALAVRKKQQEEKKKKKDEFFFPFNEVKTKTNAVEQNY
jgi:hypothetical protein